MDGDNELRREFGRMFGEGGDVRRFRAPGRVELIGGHVDYNDGWVLPMTIDRDCTVLARWRGDRILRMHSVEFRETAETEIGAGEPNGESELDKRQHHWSRYVEGVAWSLAESGVLLSGADLYIASEIPMGAGLSSSAALEVATGLALSRLSGTEMQPTKLALACQRAENEFVGLRCGIMDQLAACHGRSDHALLIDCRTLDVAAIPLDSRQVCVVLANTMTRHALAGSEYNRRRRECEEAVRRIAARRPDVKALRDVTWEEISEEAEFWPEEIRRRARHVTTEILRVLSAAEALRDGDYPKLGRLMNESHRSLAEDFEVSSPELNWMVELAGEIDGVLGARMMGGGFGGSTVNLVTAERAEEFATALARRYRERTGISAEILACRAAEGAEEVLR